MDIIFESDVKNRYTVQVEGYGTVYFNKGTKITQDKELIKKLLNHPNYERNDYRLVTNDDVVAKYLEGDDPDQLTREILDNITRQGIVELGKALHCRQNQPTLLKIELEGKPINNKVLEILDFYKIEKNKDEVKQEIDREEKQVETVTNNVSTDMLASEAVEYIEGTSADQLDGFVTEEEDRVTVKRAYEDKMNK